MTVKALRADCLAPAAWAAIVKDFAQAWPCQQIPPCSWGLEFRHVAFEEYSRGAWWGKDNPKFPILVRECSGIQPKMYARYAYGKETSVQLNNLTSDGVLQAMEKLVTSEAL